MAAPTYKRQVIPVTWTISTRDGVYYVKEEIGDEAATEHGPFSSQDHALLGIEIVKKHIGKTFGKVIDW